MKGDEDLLGKFYLLKKYLLNCPREVFMHFLELHVIENLERKPITKPDLTKCFPLEGAVQLWARDACHGQELRKERTVGGKGLLSTAGQSTDIASAN